MNEPLTCLHTEAMTAEREWTVDDVPALSAAVSLPEPVPAADRVSRRNPAVLPAPVPLLPALL